MGKKIDIFLLSVGFSAAAYFYFCGSIHNRLIAFLLAFFIFTVFSKLIRRTAKKLSDSRWMTRRRIRKNADRLLLALACADPNDAKATLGTVLTKAYREGCPIALLQQHPSTAVNENAVFECWKAHRGEEKLIVCATGRAGDGVRFFARELRSPKVALVDASALAALAAEYPDAFRASESAENKTKRLSLRGFRFALIDRRNAPRTILLALGMLTMYFFSFGKLYLIASVFLLALTAVSLRRRGRPARLF